MVVPARIAGIQVDMDVFGRVLRAWMPAVHAGMTKPPTTVGRRSKSASFIFGILTHM
jgi:hypothetical protein